MVVQSRSLSQFSNVDCILDGIMTEDATTINCHWCDKLCRVQNLRNDSRAVAQPMSKAIYWPCQSGCTVSLLWYACCWLEIDRSMIQLHPNNVRSLEPLGVTLPVQYAPLIFTEPCRFATGLGSTLILSNTLVWSALAVSAIWLCG